MRGRLRSSWIVIGLIVLAAACASSTSEPIEVRGTVESAPVTTTPATNPTESTTVPPPTTTASERLVLYLGDSITVQAADALLASTVGQAQVVAVTGARTIDMVDLAKTAATQQPDVVVINLGTNDEACVTNGGCADGYLPTTAELAAELRRLAGHFPNACRLGVTITFGLDQPPMVNPALDDMAAAEILAGVVDWATHRSEMEPEADPWLVDFLGHLTEAGALALADLVGSDVDRVCR